MISRREADGPKGQTIAEWWSKYDPRTKRGRGIAVLKNLVPHTKLAARPLLSYTAPVSTDDQYGSAGGGFLLSGFVYDGGDKDRSGHVGSVFASFTGLSTGEVDADFESLGDVLRVANHLIGGENISAACVAMRNEDH